MPSSALSAEQTYLHPEWGCPGPCVERTVRSRCRRKETTGGDFTLPVDGQGHQKRDPGSVQGFRHLLMGCAK